MTDEKRRDEAREIVHRLRDRYNAPGHELKLDLVEATDLVVAALASRDAEIERLRSDYNTTITYNIDERAKLASLLKEKDAEIERLQQWVSRLNNREAAARLRAQPAADDVELSPVLRDWCEEHNRGELPDGLCPECEEQRKAWLSHKSAQLLENPPAPSPKLLTEPALCWENPAADDVERAEQLADRICRLHGETYIFAIANAFAAARQDALCDTVFGVRTAISAARQDARRQALEEAAQIAKDAADFTSGMDIQFVSPAKFAACLALDISDNIIALADKAAATSTDIISLFRAYRRAVEASPVSNVLELQEWRDLCAAMNAIDAAEGAR